MLRTIFLRKIFEIAAVASIATLSINSSATLAQESYPSRPVRIIVSLPPGSSPDIRMRVVANQLTAIWGRQAVVENRPGAGGALGAQAVLSAPADGYTLLATVASVFTILPAQRDKLSFEPSRDFVPLALTSSEGMVIAVSPKLDVNNLAEFIALARTRPDKLVIGTNPAGSLPHLAARLLVNLTKAPLTIVPFSSGGTNEAVREILGGRVHAVIETRPALKAHLDSGDLKALAIMTRERVSVVPDLPTATETVPGLAAIGWTGLFAPRGTPTAIVRQLSANIRQAMEAPEAKAKLEQTGTPYPPLFTDDFARFIDAEQKLWWPVVKEAGLH
jgi:tripartite-type tricarboxylate transporter receptor subunit TctC